MIKLGKIMRKEMFDWEFSGNFLSKCQQNSVPPVVKNFMSLLLNGPHMQHEDVQDSQAFLTLSQLVCFSVKSRRYQVRVTDISKTKKLLFWFM